MIRAIPTVLLMISVLTVSCWADETDPGQILEKVRTTYKSMETYKSEGTVAVNMEQEATTTEFLIVLKKPNLYRISWSETSNLTPQNVQSGTVWSDGTQPYLYMGMTKSYSKISGDQNAIAAATGISSGAAWTIPTFFFSMFKGQPDRFARLMNVKLEGIEKVGDEECYVISGDSKISKKETFWISKLKNLIVNYSHSLEAPEGGQKMPEMSDEQITQTMKAMGQEVTEEKVKQMKEQMNMARTLMNNVKLKGSSTEIHTQISSPELATTDFQFALPEGTVLKESFFDFSGINK